MKMLQLRGLNTLQTTNLLYVTPSNSSELDSLANAMLLLENELCMSAPECENNANNSTLPPN